MTSLVLHTHVWPRSSSGAATVNPFGLATLRDWASPHSCHYDYLAMNQVKQHCLLKHHHTLRKFSPEKIIVFMWRNSNKFPRDFWTFLLIQIRLFSRYRGEVVVSFPDIWDFIYGSSIRGLNNAYSPANVIREIKSRRMRLVRERWGLHRSYKILVWKSEGKGLPRRPKLR
jgi:hypothetical protein